MELRIELLGHPHYQLDGGPRTPFHGKRVAQVVGLLALLPEHGASRREIQRQIWGEARTEDDARKALAFLRQEHPDFAHYLEDAPSWIQLRSPSDEKLAVRVDVREFERESAAGRYEKALTLARGRLLENVQDGESSWLTSARQRWHAEIAHAWREVALQRWHEHRHLEAIQLAERSLQWRSDDPDATTEVALLLAHDGQRQRGMELLQALLKSQRLVNPWDERNVRKTVELLDDPDRQLPPVVTPSVVPLSSPGVLDARESPKADLHADVPVDHVAGAPEEEIPEASPEVRFGWMRPGRRWGIVAAGSCAIAIVIAAAGVSITRDSDQGDAKGRDGSPLVDPPTAQSPRPAKRRVVVVDNRVTRGTHMADDPLPLRLTTKPWVYCLKRSCAIRGTERKTGQTYDAAICQTKGDRTTNGDLGSDADNKNPRLYTSDRYYRVQQVDDTFGYVSDVWVRARDRGGLGLPPC